jgi:ABC-2 type transport system ATP-binding protein
MGYVPDLNSFYEEMTCRDFVYVMARLYGMSRSQARSRTAEVIEEVGMSDRAGRRLAGCSHGMRQRIKLAQALVNDPPILLLDEPLSGIDPGGRREISRLLLAQGEKGKTILISSHILGETESLTDSVLIIARGRIVASGTLTEIRALLEDRPLTVEVGSSQSRQLAALLIPEPEVRGIELRGDSLVIQTRNPGRFFSLLNDLVAQHGLDVSKLRTLDGGADAVFNYLQQGAR